MTSSVDRFHLITNDIAQQTRLLLNFTKYYTKILERGRNGDKKWRDRAKVNEEVPNITRAEVANALKELKVNKTPCPGDLENLHY